MMLSLTLTAETLDNHTKSLEKQARFISIMVLFHSSLPHIVYTNKHKFAFTSHAVCQNDDHSQANLYQGIYSNSFSPSCKTIIGFSS